MGNGHLSFGQATDVGLVPFTIRIFGLFVVSPRVDERPDFGLFLAGDGMGGHHDGEKASSADGADGLDGGDDDDLHAAAVRVQRMQPPITEALIAAIEKANANVICGVPDGGTTLTSAIIIGDLAYVAHVGDQPHLPDHQRPHRAAYARPFAGAAPDRTGSTHACRSRRAFPQKTCSIARWARTRRSKSIPSRGGFHPNPTCCFAAMVSGYQVEEADIFEVVMSTPNLQEACNKLIALANKHRRG